MTSSAALDLLSYMMQEFVTRSMHMCCLQHLLLLLLSKQQAAAGMHVTCRSVPPMV
jgi:hypothetical protein